jgi:hypothetical protein
MIINPAGVEPGLALAIVERLFGLGTFGFCAPAAAHIADRLPLEVPRPIQRDSGLDLQLWRRMSCATKLTRLKYVA